MEMMETSTIYIISNLDGLFNFYHNAIQRSRMFRPRAAPPSDGVYFPRFRELLHCLWSTIKAICSHLESPLYRR